MHYKKYKSILSAKNGINVYRGCTHGCIYCDSRSKCYSMEHEFEDVEVKTDAPLMLENELKKKRKKCMVGTGSMCDPYMHCEAQLGYTRKCLEAIEKNGFGATLITKSSSVLRDIDLLKRINEKTKCVVQMTMTTYDEKLCRIVEPNVSTTRERFEALCTLRDNKIPCVVWLSPVLPFINDTMENLKGILDYCFEAEVVGILCFGMGLTLREGNREYFYSQLDRHFPGMKEKYIKTFGDSYGLESPDNYRLMKYFREECRRHGVMNNTKEIFEYLGKFEDKSEDLQLSFC